MNHRREHRSASGVGPRKAKPASMEHLEEYIEVLEDRHATADARAAAVASIVRLVTTGKLAAITKTSLADRVMDAVSRGCDVDQTARLAAVYVLTKTHVPDDDVPRFVQAHADVVMAALSQLDADDADQLSRVPLLTAALTVFHVFGQCESVIHADTQGTGGDWALGLLAAARDWPASAVVAVGRYAALFMANHSPATALRLVECLGRVSHEADDPTHADHLLEVFDIISERASDLGNEELLGALRDARSVSSESSSTQRRELAFREHIQSPWNARYLIECKVGLESAFAKGVLRSMTTVMGHEGLPIDRLPAVREYFAGQVDFMDLIDWKWRASRDEDRQTALTKNARHRDRQVARDHKRERLHGTIM